MEKLYEDFKDKLEFIGINVGVNESLKKVRRYVKKKGLKFKIVYDRHTLITRKFGVIGTPTHIIIDRRGVIRYIGATPPEGLEKHLKEL